MGQLNNEYRKLWQPPDYHPEMGSAAVVKPPSNDFLRLYHLTTAQHAISNVIHQRLKVARFGELNDPFELMAPRLSDPQLKQAVSLFRLKFSEECGVLCFSKDWISPALWGHYADKHKGICLGFDVRRELVQPVDYLHDRVDWKFQLELDDEMLNQFLYSKAECWNFEEERRLLIKLDSATINNGLYFHAFNDNIRLREVILGMRCDATLDSIRKTVNALYTDVATFSVRPADKWFRLVPDENSLLEW